VSSLGKALRHNALFLFFMALFVVALVGQALSGVAADNAQRMAEDLPQLSLL
jgi:hypothetical protein